VKKIFILLFLLSCSPANLKNDLNNDVLNFNKDLSFNEFKNLLDKYNKISNFPVIDK